MGFFRFFDETVDFFISDIRKQTGKGFIETFTDKGNYGEFLSYKYLINTPGKRAYIHNCYIPTANGFTEIDFILLHETGVYVVESKNYSGWIFGDEKSKNWMQVLAGGKTRNRFLNPIYQNVGHIKALKAFLKEYPDLRYYSLVVFSERCELKKVSCTLPDTYVVKRDDLKRVFKRQIKEREKLSESMLAEVAELLKPYCRVNEEEKVAHIERIKAMQARMVGKSEKGKAVQETAAPGLGMDSVQVEAVDPETGFNADITVEEDVLVIDAETVAEIIASEAAMAAEETAPAPIDDESDADADDVAAIAETTLMICPRCRKRLVERKGKNGPFIGCTGFPHCRYTQNLG